MIKVDEDALICDLAETYQIYDYRQLPPKMVAVFSYGLKEDSRIKMKLSGQTVPSDTLLLASMVDKLNTLVWFKTKDGQKGKNMPPSIVSILTGQEKSDVNKDMVVFNSGEDFINRRKMLLQTGGE